MKCKKCFKKMSELIYTDGYLMKYGELCFLCNPDYLTLQKEYLEEIKLAKDSEDLKRINDKYFKLGLIKFI